MHYRNCINGGFSVFNLKYRYSDILVGTKPSNNDNHNLQTILYSEIKTLYSVLEDFIEQNPNFKRTHSPWKSLSNISFIDRMIRSSVEADVGPMAAVAGAFADILADKAQDYADEIWIENGGDIALQCKDSVCISIYQGWGKFESDIFLKIPSGNYGIASSSGRYGHSFSRGKADMVTVVSENSAKSDAFATSIGNLIKPGCDPEKILENYKNLLSVTIIWQGKMWHQGKIELTF
jgi:ApbE superfamily uncharacterized protein (UPF0280 family)